MLRGLSDGRRDQTSHPSGNCHPAESKSRVEISFMDGGNGPDEKEL